MKNKHFLFLMLLSVLTAVGFSKQKQVQNFIYQANDNEFIKKMKENFKTFTEKRQGERVYLQTDKPFYKPNETIWIAAYLRNETNLDANAKSGIINIEFVNPQGNKIKEFKIIAKNGAAQADIFLDESLPGGLYKLKAYTNWQKNDANPFLFEKDIQVQKIVLPRLKMKLDFDREAFGKGETVEATLTLNELTNKPLKNYDFKIVANLRGEKIIEKQFKTDKDGTATIAFQLPKNLDTQDALLNILIDYQGQTESISRTIPVVLNQLNLEFFAEGGDLVSGINSKIAYRITNEFGKPADAQGIVVNSKNETVAEFKSLHQGLGTFLLTPKTNETYTAKILNPKDIDQTFLLPRTLQRGYTLSIKNTTPNKIKIGIGSTESEELSLILQIRGKIYYSNALKINKNEVVLDIPTQEMPIGVAQITLFDAKNIERAERLVFVNADKQLNIDIKTNKEQYLPREEVKLSVSVLDDRGLPMPAQLSISVVDDKIIAFADDKQGHILSKLLLEPDLKTEVYEPNFYFDKNEPKSNMAMDLLMLTQGWRRFVWKDIVENKEFMPQFAAETNTLKGIVYDEQQKPAPNITLTVEPAKKTYTTNEKGEFTIYDLELYEPQTLTAKDKKGITATAYITQYDQNISLYFNRMVPMMFNNIEGAANMEMAQPQVRRILKNKVKDKDNLEPMLDDALVAMPIDKQKPIGKQQNQNIANNQDMEQQQDDRQNAKQRLPMPIEQQPAITYYRAKEFPKTIYKPNAPTETRTDFRETIFWKGNIETDRKGLSEITFFNNDAITSFRATAEGIGTDGLVGHTQKVYFTQLPFSMDIKMPAEITAGDLLNLPLNLANNTNNTLNGTLNITAPKGFEPINKNFNTNITLNPNQKQTIYLPYRVGNQIGKSTFKINFKSNTDQDAFEQDIETTAKGFPTTISVSEQKMKHEFDFTLKNTVEGSIKAKLVAYPTALSDLLAGVQSILQEPYGCFEQASSSTYPNIMVLKYLQETDNKDEKTKKHALDLLDKGYKKLTAYETKEKGYEWFGATPAHEALTAYGLMEFVDMKNVYAGVDNAMIDRTAQWLMSRKNNTGGFQRNPQALDAFGAANEDITNAYIVYALSEAGFVVEIRTQLENAYNKAQQNQDPYQMALIANALFNVKDPRAEAFLQTLQKTQQQDGSFKGKIHSITVSMGQGLGIETTALSALAMLKSSNKKVKNIDDATRFIIKSRSPYGGFGNTQATVLALKALTEYAKFAKRTQESGDITVWVNGKQQNIKHFEADQQGEIAIENLENDLKTGKNNIKIEFKNCKQALPYNVSILYNSFLPQTNDKCAIDLQTNLDKTQTKMGETVRLTTTIKNKTEKGLPMTIATIGIPAGLSPQPFQLKELQDKKIIDFYEIIGNNVVFYYRQMLPNEQKIINLDLKADITGEFEAQASAAYLYYTNELKTWVEGKKIIIQ